MVYGFISLLDDETTKVFFRCKRIPVNNIYSAGGLGAFVFAREVDCMDIKYIENKIKQD